MGGRTVLTLLPLAALLAACVDNRGAENVGDWYDDKNGLQVEEPIEFTDQPYDFTGATPIADIPLPDEFHTMFAAEDPPPLCDGWVARDTLPVEIEGIVTIHPRYYFKADGCVPIPGSVDDDNPISNADSDEKYYGSYFIEDSSGGMFVLGDSKVAHFDMGDRVRLTVRATRNAFDLNMIAAHDRVEVLRSAEPIYYQEAPGRFTLADTPEVISRVHRVTGTVITDPDTFGEFKVRSDDDVDYTVTLDVELNRRGVRYDIGTRIVATGPVMYAYETFAIIIMRVGQIEVLSP